MQFAKFMDIKSHVVYIAYNRASSRHGEHHILAKALQWLFTQHRKWVLPSWVSPRIVRNTNIFVIVLAIGGSYD
jgi:hypothetical protein